MAYLTTILGLLATLIAIRGNTWDASAPSWRHLTRVGWAALVIALAACTLEIYKVHAEHALRERNRLTAHHSINEITGEVWLRLEMVAPSRPNVNERVKFIKSDFDRIAREYDETLSVFKDYFEASESEAVLHVSNTMRQTPSSGDRWFWDAYILVLDQDREKLASIFCNGSPKDVADCKLGVDLSQLMDPISPKDPVTPNNQG